MGSWILMARGSCEMNTGAYCNGKMEVDAKGSCEINTDAYCYGNMEVDGNGIM